MPGVQKPHWRPWFSVNARCTGCRVPSGLASDSDRGDLGAVELRGEHQARAGGLAVDQHGARAARALLAARVGAGEGQLVAQEVQQQGARLDEHVVRRAVHGDRDADLVRHSVPPRVRWPWRARGG